MSPNLQDGRTGKAHQVDVRAVRKILEDIGDGDARPRDTGFAAASDARHVAL
jgi:hypothetical protein